MKTMMIALAFAGIAGITATSSAFAQSAGEAPAPAATAQAGQWVSPDSQAVAPKTRAQVYQELVHAEQDGQLDYLNRTLYWHH
jgi:hypothetical protein